MQRNGNGPDSLSGDQIRQKFLSFFAKREHQILPSASLIPEDPTVLLTIAGMLPFKPVFLGQQDPVAKRVTTSQKCIRTNDIENVGRTARHHTFFEMLGNFSFGDYFKEQAISWAWELSTEVFQLPVESLVVSVFEDDDEAYQIWQEKIGVNPARIKRMGADDNFWVSGPTGPCGPCSELYYDFHPELGDQNIDLEDDSRFIEFYNLVFMQYNRDIEGNLTPLQNKNIDTGMGLERMAQILQKVPNNYETDLIFPIIEKAAQLANLDYQQVDQKTKISLKVIGDHIRALIHLVSDGVSASNIGRGYILRRLLRRVVRHGRLLGINEPFTVKVAQSAIDLAQKVYPQVRENQKRIELELQKEELRFLETLERGEKILSEILEKSKTIVSGKDAFLLYDTYGFPLELTEEIAQESGLSVNVQEFELFMSQQKERSSSAHQTIDLTVQESLDSLAQEVHSTEFVGYSQSEASALIVALLYEGKKVDEVDSGNQLQIILNQTPFYAESGGQIGDKGYLLGENLIIRIFDVQKEGNIFVHFGQVERGLVKIGDQITARIDLATRRRLQVHHSATHLLQAALKKIVDPNISQAGSLVSFDQLRFDFNCPKALTKEEIEKVENLINSWIAEGHPTETSILPLEEAKAKGAIAMFGEKYGAEVRVVDVPGVSLELCGGTHVKNTAEIGLFKIVSESGISSGVRRIEAIAGAAAVLEYLKIRDQIIKDLSDRFKVKPEEIQERITTLQSELKNSQKQLESVKQELAILKSDQLLLEAQTIGQFKILVASLPETEAEALKSAAERLQQKLGEAAVVLGSSIGTDKVNLVAAFSAQIYKDRQLSAGKFIGEIAQICGGGGGGRPNLAQAGGRDPQQLSAALETAKRRLKESLS
jgi:alanyl-tRNA synthetase